MPEYKKEKVRNEKITNNLLEALIRSGTLDEACRFLSIKEKDRLIEECMKSTKNEKIKKVQEEADLEESDLLEVPMEKFHLVQQENKRIDHERKMHSGEEETDILKETKPEFIWKDFYKDKPLKERYCLLKEELERVIEETNARRKTEHERLEKEEQRINFLMRKMDEEGIWYGQSLEEKERATVQRSAFCKAEKDFEIKKAGIIAEMESIVRAYKESKPDNKLH